VCADLASAGRLADFPLFAATLEVMHRRAPAQAVVDALAKAQADEPEEAT